jgi:predicted phosphodiesterase
VNIALQSDLHLEFQSQWPKTPEGVDVIIWAGDIHYGRKAIDVACEVADSMGCDVIVVAGNHEYFNSDYHQTLREMRQAAQAHKRVHFLEQDSIQLGDVAFWGATFWSDFLLLGEKAATLCQETAKEFLPDFNIVGFQGGLLSPESAVSIHKESLVSLQSFLATTKAHKHVVITHFAPHPTCDHQRYAASPFRPYFISDQRALMECLKPDLWCYGHTHDSKDFLAGKTRVVSNQFGYPHEGKDFTAYRDELLIKL